MKRIEDDLETNLRRRLLEDVIKQSSTIDCLRLRFDSPTGRPICLRLLRKSREQIDHELLGEEE